jgi:hypothetical protein
MEHVKGKGAKSGYILDGHKKITFEELAEQKRCSKGYIVRRLREYKTVEKALDFDISIRKSGIFGGNKKIPKLKMDELFYKAMKAISMTSTACGGL